MEIYWKKQNQIGADKTMSIRRERRIKSLALVLKTMSKWDCKSG